MPKKTSEEARMRTSIAKVSQSVLASFLNVSGETAQERPTDCEPAMPNGWNGCGVQG